VDNWDDFSQGPLGALTLGFGLTHKKFSMRVFRALPPMAEADLEEKREQLVDIIKRKGRFRIGKQGGHIFVTSTEEQVPDYDQKDYYRVCNDVVKRHRSEVTTLLFLSLPNINTDAQQWLELAMALTEGLGPCILYMTCAHQQIMSRKL
jgi:hypothetical protein